MTIATQPLAQAWSTLQSLVPVFPIRNEKQYERALDILNALLDKVNDDETHPLYDFLDTLVHEGASSCRVSFFLLRPSALRMRLVGRPELLNHEFDLSL